MADDRDPSQQTEEPTQKRLQEAQEQGDIVKSPEVSAFVLLLGGTLAIMMFGGSATKAMAIQLRYFVEQPEMIAVDPADIMVLMRQVLVMLGTILGPVFAVLM